MPFTNCKVLDNISNTSISFMLSLYCLNVLFLFFWFLSATNFFYLISCFCDGSIIAAARSSMPWPFHALGCNQKTDYSIFPISTPNNSIGMSPWFIFKVPSRFGYLLFGLIGSISTESASSSARNSGQILKLLNLPSLYSINFCNLGIIFSLIF